MDGFRSIGSVSNRFDRADLYVAFIEKSLTLLRPEGRLGFICADRWMKNRYGGPLRQMVSEGFHLESYVDFTECPAFFDDVDSYPAVSVIRKGRGEQTSVAFRPAVSREALVPLAKAITSHEATPLVSIVSGVCHGLSRAPRTSCLSKGSITPTTISIS